MTDHAAAFFTLDEVNRLKIIHDVVDQRPDHSEWPRSARVFPIASADAFSSVTINQAH